MYLFWKNNQGYPHYAYHCNWFNVVIHHRSALLFITVSSFDHIKSLRNMVRNETIICEVEYSLHIGQVTEMRLSCNFVLLSTDIKTRYQASPTVVTWLIWSRYKGVSDEYPACNREFEGSNPELGDVIFHFIKLRLFQEQLLVIEICAAARTGVGISYDNLYKQNIFMARASIPNHK